MTLGEFLAKLVAPPVTSRDAAYLYDGFGCGFLVGVLVMLVVAVVVRAL